MMGHRGSDPRMVGLVKVVNQVERLEDARRATYGGLIEKSVPIEVPSGFRVDMYGNEPEYHEAHVRVRYKGGDGNYTIEDGRFLNGTVEGKYELEIQKWIQANQSSLRECWQEIKDAKLGCRPKTAWWGSDGWRDDVEDDSSPAACRVLVVSAASIQFEGCSDGPLNGPSILNTSPARFIIVASGEKGCLGLLKGTTISESRQVTMLSEFEGDQFVAEIPWLENNVIEVLAATLYGLSFDDLRDLAGAQ